MRRVFLLLGLLGLASSCLAEVLPLPALLDGTNSTPLLRAAEAEGAALEALQRQREAEAGWQWFASAGTGRYRELVTEEVRDDYYGRDLALGLRHPLLGSLKRQQDALRSVQFAVPGQDGCCNVVIIFVRRVEPGNIRLDDAENPIVFAVHFFRGSHERAEARDVGREKTVTGSH